MSIKALPPMEHTFTLENIKGTDTGQMFSGTFTYKRPNLRAKSEIDKTRARLDEGLANLSDDIVFMHSVLASLRHTIVKSPTWWEEVDFGYELYDSNVILEIWKQCRDFENEYTKKVYGEPEPKEDGKAEGEEFKAGSEKAASNS